MLGEFLRRGSIIDDLHNQILRELITLMTKNPSIISNCISILRIAKTLNASLTSLPISQ